jgi:hypothetical protein
MADPAGVPGLCRPPAVIFHEPHVDGGEAKQGDQVKRRLVRQQGKGEISA